MFKRLFDKTPQGNSFKGFYYVFFMINLLGIILFALIGFSLKGISANFKNLMLPAALKKEALTLSDKTFTVELASTKSEQEKGLMFIKKLPKNQGMLFAFKTPVDYAFWMKNTLIPLSVIFFSDGRAVDFKNMTPCKTKNCPLLLYISNKPYTEALEINRGIFSKKIIGKKLTLTKIIGG